MLVGFRRGLTFLTRFSVENSDRAKNQSEPASRERLPIALSMA